MSAALKFNKVISELPQSLEPDAVYFVRTGDGFNMFVTDETGNVAFQMNPRPPALADNESFFVVSDGFDEFELTIIS